MIRMPLDSVPSAGGFGASAGDAGSISVLGTGAATAGDASGLLEAEGGTAGAEGHDAGAGPAHPGLVPVTADTAADLAEWDARITRMLRAGELRVREVTPDAAVKGRTQQRLTQLYKGRARVRRGCHTLASRAAGPSAFWARSTPTSRSTLCRR